MEKYEDKPVFYSPNRINATTQITVPSGSAAADRLFDRAPGSVWKNDKPGRAVLEFSFYQPEIISTVVLQNTNASSAHVDLRKESGGEWSPAGTGLSREGAIQTDFPAVGAEGLRLTLDGPERLFVGQVWALEGLFKSPVGFDEYAPKETPVRINVETADGGIKSHVMRWAGDNAYRWGATFSFLRLSWADKEKLKNIFLTPFVLRPEPLLRPGAVYLVQTTDDFKYQYLSKIRSLGYSLGVSVREI